MLVYDPYDATIDWLSIMPFINSWSEVILNHMVSDSIRAIKTAKSQAARQKYEQTYLEELEKLRMFGSDRAAYENQIKQIILALRQSGQDDYYIASFPFFNEKNAIVYDLMHCTSNVKGYKVYKECAWEVFDGKSSAKKTYGSAGQMIFNLDENGGVVSNTDEYCYNIANVVDYVYDKFKDHGIVSFDAIWEELDKHPVFPTNGFKNEIKDGLKISYGVVLHQNCIDFGVVN